jgi:hypothetical protein
MTCRRAAELISTELDRSLSLPARAGLLLHTLVCGACRCFRQQLGTIDAAGADFLTTAGPTVALPDDTKDHLRLLIANRLEENNS